MDDLKATHTSNANYTQELQGQAVCECIDVRVGEIPTAGGTKPVFILELHNETIEQSVIKYFNCNSKTKGNYTVPHNSDFAKLYRSTLGENPTKRFSKAHQLLRHFLGQWFIAKYKNAIGRNDQPYLKVIHIKPETPVRNDAWTLNGTLKKTPFQTRKKGDDVAIGRRQSGEKQAKNKRQAGDSESLQAAESLGLEHVFNPTKPPLAWGKTTNPQDQVPEPKMFFHSKRENESTDAYFDRVIDETFFP